MRLRRLERLAIWAGVTYALCCGCKTSHAVALSSESKLDEETHLKAEGQKHEGPTWTLEFAPLDMREPDAPDGGTDAAAATSPALNRHSRTDGLPPHGPLLKATYTGPVDTSWTGSSDGLRGLEESTDLKTKDESKPSPGCALGLGFGGVLAVVGVLLAGALYLRFRP